MDDMLRLLTWWQMHNATEDGVLTTFDAVMACCGSDGTSSFGDGCCCAVPAAKPMAVMRAAAPTRKLGCFPWLARMQSPAAARVLWGPQHPL